MHLCYMDESGTPDLPGNTSHFILVGLSIPVWHWKTCDREIAELKQKHFLDDEEIHCAWMLRRYLEQTKIKDFARLRHDDRRVEVEKFRNAELLRLQRTSGTRYRQAKKNYSKTAPYIHLTEDERRKFISEAAKTLSQWALRDYSPNVLTRFTSIHGSILRTTLEKWLSIRLSHGLNSTYKSQEQVKRTTDC